MSEHMNDTLTEIPGANWDEGVIRVDVFTGEDGSLEGFPICLGFPDDEPCLTIRAARLLADALIEAADLSERAVPTTPPDDEALMVPA